ncbi:P-loop containing nucleoside triphosphate hydrolase protein [Hyaloscypha bicolor E]|uniref:P-loop containing nucleoside triphosphate hydrolase protein n=1 Tax=Hyaloscypha bicolor E TaxID=1095630 RepID=A0A2J6SJQ3_9HELO|nr:P-loop containing nucleoside triphosphate hydrolase protein [Hyaloscypha bicolor E]PMD50986.1 P-loop containing nucleoside triphosphate hydrolase protein [Hyaloscypha bicolor E]
MMLWKRNKVCPPKAIASKSAKDIATPDSTVDGDSEVTIVAPPVIPGRDPDFGTSTAIKTFYEGKNSRSGHYDWVETPPKQLAVKVAKANNRVAIKIFKIKDHEQPTISGKTPLKIHMIEVQSSLLVAALKDIVKDEGMFLETTETAKFNEPFKPLFFCYDKIMALYEKRSEGSLLKEHLGLLVQVMSELFGGFMSHLKHLNTSGLISYKLAWTYFAKDTMLFNASKDAERVCKVVGTSYQCGSPQERPHLLINCEEIAFDGECFAWKPIDFKIPLFAGNLPVTELPNYPLSFHADQEGVKERLAARAKKTLEYQDLHYCEYSGVGLLPTGCGFQRHNVASRILIDFFGYQKHQEGLQRNETSSRRRRTQPQAPQPPATPAADAASISGQSTNARSLSKELQEENKQEILDRKEDLVFVSPLLRGFALKNKLWLYFYVDDIEPVVWNDEAYGHLVYPEEQKDLVLTFVDNHQRLKGGVDDVIMGKGQGLILLLSGPPGTGKTLTAEAVADKTRRPLYYLQAEDLGTNAAHLGPKIKKVFEMATEWDAVILLDEADVFMAQRDPGDIARNELVSIFLRELEYFKGIIFLTTNLYSTIDAAFRSRVNIHLVFKPLPFSSRLVLWQKFLSRLPGPEVQAKVSKKEMDELAKWELNGREIKNAIKTVRTWCVCKGFEMNLLKLESGIKVTAPQAEKSEVRD